MNMISRKVLCIRKDVGITEGNIYTVKHEGMALEKPTYFLVECDETLEYYASYFTLVECKSSLPITDELSFFKNTALGYCPCNLLREACEYHR